MKTLFSTFHEKLNRFRLRKPEPPQTNAQTGQPAQDGWFSPASANSLLTTPLRRKMIDIIWQRTSLSTQLFTELYHAPIARFAALVQLLPASEYHHHSYPGGLLDHTLEVMAFAAKLRQRHLLPIGSAPEEQAHEAEAWTAAILYAALLHDVGKIATDMEVITEDNQHWYPWQGALSKPYRLKYRPTRTYPLHASFGSFIATQIIPVAALNWLAQHRELYEAFLFCLSGHLEQSGIIGELVQQADQASVAQFMGANANQALQRPQPSLAKQMLTALRDLVQTQFKLSNPHSGSDGWLTEDSLWLISKTTADKIRAWLLQQGISSVPDSNSRLFDEMQAHGLIVPTPEGKAVWTCNINADSGWTPGCSLTLLRLSPAQIWNSLEQRPALFAGKVIPADGSNTATTSSISGNEAELTDLTLSLFAVPEPKANTATAPAVTEPPTPASPAIPLSQQNEITAHTGSGEDFVDWLKQGIQTHKIAVNDTLARVHMVEGKVFLVSPEIFKLYVRATTGCTGEEWKQVQKAFQKLKLHQRDNDGVNIFTCEVKGPRKTRRVKGYLLAEPEKIFGDNVPEDNPYLSVT